MTPPGWPEYIRPIQQQYFSEYFPPIFFVVTWQIFLHDLEGVVEPLCDAHHAVIPGLKHSQKYRIWSSWLRPPFPTLPKELFLLSETKNIYQTLRVIVRDTITEGFCKPGLFGSCLI